MVSNLSAPIDFSPSQAFDGNDGEWSTFIIRVGSPEQNFRVLPAAATGETVIPLPDGCIKTDPPDCGARRGVFPFQGHSSNGFLVNESTTWHEIGLYDADLKKELNYNVNALYGLDNIGLMAQNSGGLTISNQVVAGIAAKEVYVGLLGLNPKAANFSEFGHPQKSLLTTLRDEGKIPTLSYGYTAGAFYKSPKVLGSLTLGGYDQSRVIPNSEYISIPFDPDDSRPLSLKIQRISASNSLQGTVSLLDNEIYVQLDFTVAHLWLPFETCDRVQRAFGLIYDNATDLYRVNDTIHAELKKRNPSITIGLGMSPNPSERVNVELPYGAFDLQALHPMYPNATNYFPLRRGANESQYTLGRVFMQEAYVIVDHERGNFSVHQAAFPATNEPKRIMPILLPEANGTSTTRLTNPAANKISRGALAGTVVAAVAFVALLATIAVYLNRRRKARNSPRVQEILEDEQSHQIGGLHELHQEKKLGLEMAGEERYELHGQHHQELDAETPAELHDEDSRKPHELPADIPQKERTSPKI